jgi:hypothetical protein
MSPDTVSLPRTEGADVEPTLMLGASPPAHSAPSEPTPATDLGNLRVRADVIRPAPKAPRMVRQLGQLSVQLLRQRPFVDIWADRWPHVVTAVLALGDRVVLSTRTSLMDESFSMLLVHVVGVAGLCVGCSDQGRFALAPCPVARRARSLIETHGVAVWDARPATRVDGERGGASYTTLDAGGPSPLSRAAV